jgi:hypothetical protein
MYRHTSGSELRDALLNGRESLMRNLLLLFSIPALGWLLLFGCTDIQKCKVGTEGCVCKKSGECETGLMCWKDTSSAGAASSDDRGICLAEICEDTCDEPGDSCDDGSENSAYALCACGTDCSDCGPRSAALCQPSSASR